MIKKITVLLIMIVSPLMGQEKTEQEIKREIQQLSEELKKTKKSQSKLSLKKQHWVSLFTRIDGVYFPEFDRILPVSTSGIELFLGNQIYFYGQLGFYFELGHNNVVSYLGGISGVLGIGGYLLNNRLADTRKRLVFNVKHRYFY